MYAISQQEKITYTVHFYAVGHNIECGKNMLHYYTLFLFEKQGTGLPSSVTYSCAYRCFSIIFIELS